MKRPGHSRAPSMTAAMRQVVLAYADWWVREDGTGVPFPYAGLPFEVSEFRFREGFADRDGSYRVLCSLAYDGTDGPRGSR